MTVLLVFFWICLACVVYTYVGYPVLLGAWARWRARPVRKGPYRGSFSILLAAHDEERTIVRRLEELKRHAAAAGGGEILVVADGCSARTVALAESVASGESVAIRVLSWSDNRGKAAALNVAAHEARGEVLLFADARQTWADDAIEQMLANFADPEVGAVSGDLVLESAPGVLAGVGLYWRFEKWLRRRESLVHAQVGVTGAVSGVRRELFRPIPPGTLLDDVYWPLRVALEGHRVVHDPSARAFDRLPERSSAEFRRKVRTLTGNFQLARLLPQSLLPWRNPVWLAWISHKLLRLVVPWALIGMLVSSACLGGPWFHGFLLLQAAGYTLGVLGLVPAVARVRLVGAAASFLVLNAAAWCAFWVWILGRSGSAWRKVNYAPQDIRERESSAAGASVVG